MNGWRLTETPYKAGSQATRDDQVNFHREPSQESGGVDVRWCVNPTSTASASTTSALRLLISAQWLIWRVLRHGLLPTVKPVELRQASLPASARRAPCAAP